MRGMALKLMIFCLLLVATAFAVQFAVAHNGGDHDIEIEAPLEAVNCLGVPPTVTVLGLVIDISQAKGEEDETLNCAALLVGELIEVKLASDVPNSTTGLLTAVKVETEGEECDYDDECVEIEAPIQAVDTIGNTITVLGLVIDISKAEIEGDEEGELEDHNEGEDDYDHPHAPITLIAGQFVEVKLASNVPPLIATEVEVKHSGTGIEIEIVDQDGDEIEDEDDDIQVVATVTPSLKSGVKGGKKTLTFRAHSNGRVRLSGLPAGKAKLAITRIHSSGKSTGKASALIQSQQTTRVVTRLKQGK